MKKFFTLVASTAMLFAVSACNGNKNQESEQDQETTEPAQEVVYGETYTYHGADGSDVEIRMSESDALIQSILLTQDGTQKELKISADSTDETYIYTDGAEENPTTVTMHKDSDFIQVQNGSETKEFNLIDPITRVYTSKDNQEMTVVFRHYEGDKTVAEVSFNGETYQLDCVSPGNAAALYKKDDVSLQTKDNTATLKTDDKTVAFEGVCKK